MIRFNFDYWNNSARIQQFQTSFGVLTEPAIERHDVALEVRKNELDEPKDHALVRSRDGFGTNLSFLCNEPTFHYTSYLAAGQCHNSSVLNSILEEADDWLVYENGESVA